MIRRGLFAAVLAATAVMSHTAPAIAADRWIEVRSAHFAITSNASEGSTKALAWQLEQVRSALAALWPWAKLDVNKPLAVFALKDEPSMKAMAPGYWERKGGVRPASLWVGAADQNYLVIRTDLESRDQIYVNPYTSSYFSYISLILQQSVERPLPLWFSRGLAGVMSNTIVYDDKLLLGPPIPWHLDHLRDSARLKLAALVTLDRNSPQYKSEQGLQTFDAEAWALVHFLMFGDKGARWPKLDQFAKMVARGTPADAAFREAFGAPEGLEDSFSLYIGRNLFSYRMVNVDVAVKREGFTVTPVAAPQAAARQALFHAAMGRPVEARAAIEAARKGGETSDSAVAEALLLDADGKAEEAKAAFARAVEQQTTNAHAHYRLAALLWHDDMDHDTLVRVEKLLSGAIALNTRFAQAYALLAQTRAMLGVGEPVPLALRAISLEPAEPFYRLSAASVLWREKKLDEALKHAQAAASLADTDEERRQAADMIDRLTRAKGGG